MCVRVGGGECDKMRETGKRRRTQHGDLEWKDEDF